MIGESSDVFAKRVLVIQPFAVSCVKNPEEAKPLPPSADAHVSTYKHYRQ